MSATWSPCGWASRSRPRSPASAPSTASPRCGRRRSSPAPPASSEARPGRLQELGLLGRARAPEYRVATREAAEAGDDLAMPLGIAALLFRQILHQLAGEVLVVERLAVLERQ